MGGHDFVISNTTHAAYMETPPSPACRAGMQVLLRRSIYIIFADVLSHTDDYRGVQKLVSRGMRSATQVVCQHDATTWLNAHLADCLCQVAGTWANCMNDCSGTTPYVVQDERHWQADLSGPNSIRSIT